MKSPLRQLSKGLKTRRSTPNSGPDIGRVFCYRRVCLWAVILAILLLGVGDGHCRMTGGNGALGFVPLRSQSPLQQLRFGLQHRPPFVLAHGETAVYVEETWKNMWMYQAGVYLIDAEVHALAYGLYHGFGEGLEVSVELPVRYISGGILDQFIEGFHNTVGLGNMDRENYPRNDMVFAVNLAGEGSGWTYAGGGQAGWNLGNMVIGLSLRLTGLERLGVDAIGTFNIKLPTGTRTEFFGGQAADYGLALSLGRRLGRIHAYACAGIVYYGQGSMIGIELNRRHRSGLLALEYHPQSSRHSAVFQLLAENGVAKEFSQFRHGTYEAVLGYKYLASPTTLIEIGLLENMFFHDNSPDIGLHVSVIKLFLR